MKQDARLQVNPSTFDEAIWYSMYGPKKPKRGTKLWKLENESQWLLRREEGLESSSDISSEEETLSPPSSPEPTPRATAAALPTAPTLQSGAKSELSRDQRARKDKQQESRQKVLGTQYQCAESDREAEISNQGLIKFRVSNPCYITAMFIINGFRMRKMLP